MFSIAIDGPAGSGKSTVAKIIAKRLQEKGIDAIYVDTGAIYRGVTYFLIKNISENDLNSETLVSSIVEDMEIDIKYIDSIQHIYVNGEDVTEYLRTEKVSSVTPIVSAYKKVRNHLFDIQRNLAEKYNVIMDGRNIAVDILPNADLKIFLVADVEVRAKRRYKDYTKNGEDISLDEVIESIKERDSLDSERLVQTHDAIIIDTSYLNTDEVVEKIIGYLKCVK